MIMRPALVADWPILRALLEENALTVDGVAYEGFTPPCLVAVKAGEIVGFIQAHAGAPYAVITELAVARAHQRQGIGVRLLQHMETLLRSAGVTAWMAYTGEKNDRVVAQLDGYGARCTGAGTAWVKSL